MTTTLLLLALVPATEPIRFDRDVRPILSDACFACHGFDAKTRKAGLRLDVPEGALAKRKRGLPAIQPGDLSRSELWARISTTDAGTIMPPPDSNKKLTAPQKELIRRWILQGARYQKHWAFETIRRPPAPLPRGQATTPIDRFLLQRLETTGLTPQPRADRETLIRRVAFTLTGLPPTVAEVDAFLADRSPDAYKRLVERYLASPRYGEEMARHWLDVARYADTHGLHLDNERQMWAYRDWVVRAFNDNLPFDRFTLWQLAGDLLPKPTQDQLVATGFNRCNVTTSEGGSIDTEFVYRYAVERTTTVAQTWLGLTAGCAVCHDHKYDPISMKEFYSLYAFFNNAADPAMDGNINTTAPFIKLPDSKLVDASRAAAEAEGKARSHLETVARQVDYVDPAQNPSAEKKVAVRDVLLDDILELGVSARSSSRNAIEWEIDPSFGTASGRRVLRQASAADLTDTFEFRFRPVLVPGDAVLEVSVRVAATDVPDNISVSAGRGRTVTWSKQNGKLLRDKSKDAVEPGRWNRLRIPAAELNLKPGERLSTLTLSQTGGIAFWDLVTLEGNTDPAKDPLESLSVWRRTIGKEVPGEISADLRGLVHPENKLKPEDAERLKIYYLAMFARPRHADLQRARQAWEAARAARVIADESAPGTMIFRDRDRPRDSFVMLRGQYDKPGEKVQPGGIEVLPPIVRSGPGRLNRLDLANWLLAPENPLTARVAANRLWQQVFGIGLVRTSDDFGSQGELPSHPELLDWLAVEFRESGWDVKGFIKMLLLSDAFQRDARLTEEVRQLDPDNRLLARGPRIRLAAEQIRDNALFVSGLINLRMGGKGVKPYQPANIWEPVGYADSNTRFYLQDRGADLYRRSLYVFLKRTAPPPFLANFDAPNREQSCSVRERSNTPLQALQLMNDVQFFEAARALAERTLAEAGNATTDRIDFLYRTVLARRASAEEQQLVAALLERQRQLMARDPAEAAKVVAAGESAPRNLAPASETAAWTMVANLILNLDETLNRN